MLYELYLTSVSEAMGCVPIRVFNIWLSYNIYISPCDLYIYGYSEWVNVMVCLYCMRALEDRVHACRCEPMLGYDVAYITRLYGWVVSFIPMDIRIYLAT